MTDTSDPNTRLLASEYELDDDEVITGSPSTHHSPYRLGAAEQLRGVANRIIFSRYYILFYFVMMSLSLATVILSLVATSKHECPPWTWKILEVIINLLMVAEVSLRWTAYGKKYPMTLLNVIDLILVLLCGITLIVVFASPCGEGARQEEVLDTILLVIRNGVQFLRLGNILRRSGHSLFNPPRPMDLSQARAASLALDFDVDAEDEEAAAERSLVGVGRRARQPQYEPVYSDGPSTERTAQSDRGVENLSQEDQDLWDRL